MPDGHISYAHELAGYVVVFWTRPLTVHDCGGPFRGVSVIVCWSAVFPSSSFLAQGAPHGFERFIECRQASSWPDVIVASRLRVA